MHLTDATIQEKGLSTDDNSQYDNNFSNGWFVCFKKRNGLKVYKSRGEAAGADTNATLSQLPILHRLVQQYDEQNIFNTYSSALHFRRSLKLRSVLHLFQEKVGTKIDLRC